MSLSTPRTYRNSAKENANLFSQIGTKRKTFFGPEKSFFAPVTKVQPKLTVNARDDIYEKEADAMADRVMRMSDPQIQRQEEEEEEMLKPQPLAVQRKCAECEAEENLQRKPLWGNIAPFFQRKQASSRQVNQQTATSLQSSKGGGSALPDDTRSWMESRFGADFSGVKVHTDSKAIQLNLDLNAKAFTHGRDIYFNQGEFSPGTCEGKRLLAHELTHVIQQRNDEVQRVVEVRPPGRGEASAFDRRDDLIARINEQSDHVRYRLDGRRIVYEDIPSDEVILNPFGVRSPNFDQKMKGYIDRAEVVPMRLITSAGFVGGGPLLVDSLELAYVDLDDLLGRDDLSFQLNLIHILTERFGVNDYERRIGTNMPEFDRVHRAGLDDEAEHLQSVIGDPTIRFNYEETRPNGTDVFAFRSDEGYRVFHVFRRAGQAERTGEIFVLTGDRRRLTIDQLIAERAAQP